MGAGNGLEHCTDRDLDHCRISPGGWQLGISQEFPIRWRRCQRRSEAGNIVNGMLSTTNRLSGSVTVISSHH